MFEQIDPVSAKILAEYDRNPARFMRDRQQMAANAKREIDSIDAFQSMAEALCFPNSGIRFADTIRCDDVFGYGPHADPDFYVASCALKRHLRNRKEIPDSGEKEVGRSLAWVIRWQERKRERKARKLSRRAEGKIGKADRIVSYEKQKIHNPDSELVFLPDENREYAAQLNFFRILAKISCVPDDMILTKEEIDEYNKRHA
jgi:hypothetical protein